MLRFSMPMEPQSKRIRRGRSGAGMVTKKQSPKPTSNMRMRIAGAATVSISLVDVLKVHAAHHAPLEVVGPQVGPEWISRVYRGHVIGLPLETRACSLAFRAGKVIPR